MLGKLYFEAALLFLLCGVALGLGEARASLNDVGQWELENAFRGARPAWPLRGFENLPAIWAKHAAGRTERSRLSSIKFACPEFQAEVARRYGLYYEPSLPNDVLPYGLTRTRADFVAAIEPTTGVVGEPGVTFNCRGCHSGVYFGTRPDGKIFTDGLSNVFMDISRLNHDIMEAAGFRPGNLFETNLPRNSMVNAADYYGRLLTYLRQPYPSFDRISAYQAFYGRFRLPRHRHLERDIQAYLKTQYWVNVGTKWRGEQGNGLYVDGGFFDNPASIMYGVFFSRDSNGNDFLEANNGFLERGLPYLSSLEAPSYPMLSSVSEDATNRGFAIFRKTCSGCHGTYRRSEAGGFVLESYPGKIVAIDRIGTDPLRAGDAGFGAVFNGESWVPPGRIFKTGGYKAPPLHGVWARAPYLHNASVPNIRQLMNPSLRMKRFAIQPAPLDSDNYDARNMGWKVIELKTAADVERLGKADPYVRIYDPDAYPYGLTNTGHTFGAKLSDPEIDDLIAFLKHL